MRQIGPARLIATAAFLILALAFARFSWDIPLASDPKRALYDVRVLESAERVGQDERIVLVTYNDDTLEMLGKRSPLDRAMLADALGAVDAMGAKAIGIDILLDQPQAEASVLLDTLRRMRTLTLLAFASRRGNTMRSRSATVRSSSTAAPRPGRGRAGAAGEHRAGDRLGGRGDPPLGKTGPCAAALAANALTGVHPALRAYDGRIDFRLLKNPDLPVFTKLPIEVVAASGNALRDVSEGRYVLPLRPSRRC